MTMNTGSLLAYCTLRMPLALLELPLFVLLPTFYNRSLGLDLAIIGLVCLVRLLLHPITKKAQVNMLQMGKMAPEIERLKKKYGDNKDELNKAMIGVYKEQGMTPIGRKKKRRARRGALEVARDGHHRRPGETHGDARLSRGGRGEGRRTV